jgi:hypothetical protein
MASVADFCTEWDQGKVLTPREREALDQLTAFHFLFQLTDTELTLQRDLMDQGNAVDGTRIHSYLFFAAELPPSLTTLILSRAPLTSTSISTTAPCNCSGPAVSFPIFPPTNGTAPPTARNCARTSAQRHR